LLAIDPLNEAPHPILRKSRRNYARQKNRLEECWFRPARS
jgi:hypothetical protein